MPGLDPRIHAEEQSLYRSGLDLSMDHRVKRDGDEELIIVEFR
jgi:hypothetical protein